MAKDFSLPAGTHTVVVGFGDLNGNMCGKRLHADFWDKVVVSGINLSAATFLLDPVCEIMQCASVSMDNGYPDMSVYPVTKPIPIPWEEGVAFSFAHTRTVEGGAPLPIDPRRILVEQLARAEKMDLQVSIGAELEFYLLDPETKTPCFNELKVYSLLLASKMEHVIGPIRNHLNTMGIPIEQSNPEYARGQIEVNIRYGACMEVADRVIMFRNFVREIAHKHGYLATFTAKPFHDDAGSGFHTHYSLWKDGKNAFATADGTINELGINFLAGMQKRMVETALTSASTAGSYRRRQPYTFCPTNNSWGYDNRTVGLRVIEGEASAVRVEKRDGSADCNPYLLIATELAAGLDGIEQKLQPTEVCTADAYAETRHEALPASIQDALKAAQGSTWLQGVLGAEQFDVVTQYAQLEIDAIGEIDPEKPLSDAEKERYIGNM